MMEWIMKSNLNRNFIFIEKKTTTDNKTKNESVFVCVWLENYGGIRIHTYSVHDVKNDIQTVTSTTH